VVAFASDKRLDPSFLSLAVKPWFVGNRPAWINPSPPLPSENDPRQRRWPDDEAEDDSRDGGK
jgi:hypothetical protein